MVLSQAPTCGGADLGECSLASLQATTWTTDRLESAENRTYSDETRGLDRENLLEGEATWCEAARGNDRLSFGGLAVGAILAGWLTFRAARPYLARLH